MSNSQLRKQLKKIREQVVRFYYTSSDFCVVNDKGECVNQDYLYGATSYDSHGNSEELVGKIQSMLRGNVITGNWMIPIFGDPDCEGEPIGEISWFIKSLVEVVDESFTTQNLKTQENITILFYEDLLCLHGSSVNLLPGGYYSKDKDVIVSFNPNQTSKCMPMLSENLKMTQIKNKIEIPLSKSEWLSARIRNTGQKIARGGIKRVGILSKLSIPTILSNKDKQEIYKYPNKKFGNKLVSIGSLPGVIRILEVDVSNMRERDALLEAQKTLAYSDNAEYFTFVITEDENAKLTKKIYFYKQNVANKRQFIETRNNPNIFSVDTYSFNNKIIDVKGNEAVGEKINFRITNQVNEEQLYQFDNVRIVFDQEESDAIKNIRLSEEDVSNLSDENALKQGKQKLSELENGYLFWFKKFNDTKTKRLTYFRNSNFMKLRKNTQVNYTLYSFNEEIGKRKIKGKPIT